MILKWDTHIQYGNDNLRSLLHIFS